MLSIPGHRAQRELLIYRCPFLGAKDLNQERTDPTGLPPGTRGKRMCRFSLSSLEVLFCKQLPPTSFLLPPPPTFSLLPSPPLPPLRRVFVLKPRTPYVDQAALDLLRILLLQPPHMLGLQACAALSGYFELFRVSFEESSWWMTQGNLKLKANLGYTLS